MWRHAPTKTTPATAMINADNAGSDRHTGGGVGACVGSRVIQNAMTTWTPTTTSLSGPNRSNAQIAAWEQTINAPTTTASKAAVVKPLGATGSSHSRYSPSTEMTPAT